MKILYHRGNIHFQGIAGKNFILPDKWEGIEVKTLILLMAHMIREEDEKQLRVVARVDDYECKYTEEPDIMMLSGKKCPNCNSCLSYVWINNLRFFYCELDEEFYNIVNGKIEKFDLGEIGNSVKASIRMQTNGKFS